ncbi:MAG: amidase [Clostridiales bacterium]|nr:amidase [Clostridiales bacterium]
MVKAYNRQLAIIYARKWALSRNPFYYNFDSLGGDCTNFASQCVYAGSLVMNYAQNGWYYTTLNNRAPAWSGVEFFYDFLLNNNGRGPFASVIPLSNASVGDVIVLERQSGDKFHTLFISKIENERVYVCSHTRDALDMPLDYFNFHNLYTLHVNGVRI